MDDAQARALIEEIVRSESSDWDCASVNDALASLVERELGGKARVDSGLAEHLDLCPPCAELHATLLDLARMEAEGSLPGASALWRELRAAVTAVPSQAGRLGAGSGETGRSIAGRGRTRGVPTFRGASPHLAPGWRMSAAGLVAVLVLGLGWRWASTRASETDAQLSQVALQLEDLRSELIRTRAQVTETERRVAAAQVDATQAALRLDESADTMDRIGRLDRSVLDRREDGAWLRVFYTDGENRAIGVLGDLADMPELSNDAYLEGWLERPDGSVYSTGIAMRAGDALAPWTIEAQAPLGDHRAFIVTLEPAHESVFEVALGPDG